ncbi:hypothetical protein MK851_12465 [Tenacibaculum sp. 1B UA]|uniref:hypothetical protein n=1 Tax=Tenacibaculum sp. 1B UA TaxID=2922252 RepID=UPI002A244E00|nr:hypothetical protein [Tenacibaculum sp. 1B UA]MDX8554431.1 hypothetical protein [Tenacibaculum sp. 1B UA]
MNKASLENWLSSLNLKYSNEYWGMTLTMSTVNIEHWLYSRNQLKPEDLKLTLSMYITGSWVAQLERKDQLFLAQWRESGLTVESQQLKYRRLIPWPKLASYTKFPLIIPAIETALDVKFIRHIDISTVGIAPKQYLKKNSKMQQWLKPCADTFGEHISYEND